jgi:hypothetical protein
MNFTDNGDDSIGSFGDLKRDLRIAVHTVVFELLRNEPLGLRNG